MTPVECHFPREDHLKTHNNSVHGGQTDLKHIHKLHEVNNDFKSEHNRSDISMEDLPPNFPPSAKKTPLPNSYPIPAPRKSTIAMPRTLMALIGTGAYGANLAKLM